MTVGQELADARRKLGLSLTKLSTNTGLRPDHLRAIEETDLGALPPELEDSIRAYATAVQLHADDVSARYLANLPIVLNAADSFNAFESEADAADDVPGPDLLVYEPVAGHSSSVRPAPRAASAAPPHLILRSEPDLGRTSNRQDEPQHNHYFNHRRATPLATNHLVPVAALVLLSLLGAAGGYWWSANRERLWSVRSQRADNAERAALAADARDGHPDASVAHAVAPDAPSLPPAQASANAESVSADDATRALPSYKSSKARVPSDDSRGEARSTPRVASPSRSPSRTADEVPSALIVVPGSAPASASPPSTDTTGVEKKETATTETAGRGGLSGAWHVIMQPETPMPVEGNGTLAYRLQLEQRGNRVGGSAYGLTGDGSGGSSEQQPIHVVGTLNGDRLTLDFTGPASGRFMLYRSEDGAFHGRFRRGSAPSGESLMVTLTPAEHAR